MKKTIKLSDVSKTAKIGIFFAIITLIGDGFQTIINNTRPPEIDSLLFSWITACTELIFVLPIAIISHYLSKKKKDTERTSFIEKQGLDKFIISNPPIKRKQIIFRLLIVGVIFSGCAYYLIVGFSLVDSVVGILAVKTQPISMMIIGTIFLKERLSFQEVLIGIFMLIMIIFITTEGTFDLGNLSIGVIYLLIVPIFWNIGHSIAKPFFIHKILTPSEFVGIRIFLTAMILSIVYLFIGDPQKLTVLKNKDALISIFSMGALFAILHNTWYQAIKNLPLSLASLIVIPSPIVTAILVFFITQETLFLYHFIGIIGEIIGLSALFLFQRKKSTKNKKKIHIPLK